MLYINMYIIIKYMSLINMCKYKTFTNNTLNINDKILSSTLTLFFVGYPAILALGAMKRQIQLPRLPWICLVPRLVDPTLILNI